MHSSFSARLIRRETDLLWGRFSGEQSSFTDPHSTQPNFENMGNFYSIARDPIFFLHHANVDRMWSVWKTLGGKRRDFTDPDWLDAGFLFYDENAQLIRVKVRESLDTKKLGYVYQDVDVDIPWLKSKPTPRRTISTRVVVLIVLLEQLLRLRRDVYG